jgi:hypothetical protein
MILNRASNDAPARGKGGRGADSRGPRPSVHGGRSPVSKIVGRWTSLRPVSYASIVASRVRKRIATSLRRVPRLETLIRAARGEQAIFLDFPVTATPRYGYGLPPHPLLYDRFSSEREAYAQTLRSFLEFRDQFSRIPLALDESGDDPAWLNPWLPPRDACALYAFVAQWEPKLVIEIGSGISTRFARRSITDHGLTTQLVSIDPAPRASCDRLCDEVVRRPLETLDVSFFNRLGPGDVLFVDGSHRTLQNSDVTVLFLDVLTALPKGVRVHLHDITLPFDYPPSWADRYYSEQYLLAVLLLAAPTPEVLLPNTFIAHELDLVSILDPVFEGPDFRGTGRWGTSFWIQT